MGQGDLFFFSHSSRRQRVAVLSSVRRGAGPDGEAGPCRGDAATQNWVSSRGYVL